MDPLEPVHLQRSAWRDWDEFVNDRGVNKTMRTTATQWDFSRRHGRGSASAQYVQQNLDQATRTGNLFGATALQSARLEQKLGKVYTYYIPRAIAQQYGGRPREAQLAHRIFNHGAMHMPRESRQSIAAIVEGYYLQPHQTF